MSVKETNTLDRCVFGLAAFDRPEDWTTGKARETAEAALERGVRRFDVSALYGGGVVENECGKWLRDVADPGIRLTTKLGRYRDYADRPPRDGGTSDRRDLSPGATRESIDRSIDRLGDHLDTIFLHDTDAHREEALSEAYPVLLEAREEGEIAEVGVATNSAKAVLDHLEHAKFDAVMLANSHSILLPYQAALALSAAKQQGALVHVAGVYLSGILATGAEGRGKYLYHAPSDEIREKVRGIEAHCEKAGFRLRHAVLDFLRREPNAGRIVLGASRPQQVIESIEYLSNPLPDEFWSDFPTLSKDLEQ